MIPMAGIERPAVLKGLDDIAEPVHILAPLPEPFQIPFERPGRDQGPGRRVGRRHGGHEPRLPNSSSASR